MNIINIFEMFCKFTQDSKDKCICKINEKYKPKDNKIIISSIKIKYDDEYFVMLNSIIY